MISINRRALEVVERMIARAEPLGIQVSTLSCGARVIDIGLQARGGLLAGKLTAEASLGGMGEVNFQLLNFGEIALPGVCVVVDQPEIGCMASQYAGWGIQRGDFFAIGSGPARVLSAKEPVFQGLDYRDSADTAVILLEGRELPGNEVAEYLARKCRVEPSRVNMIMAPAACLAGAVQLVARVVATGMHKMFKLGFDVRKVLHGYGTCPIPPVVPNEDHASALANDCVLYGGRVTYTVRAEDAELEALIGRIPSSASPSYGTPFFEIYQTYGSFYNMDPLIFCPSQVTMNNLTSGRVFHAGQPHPGVLKTSILGEQASA
jgi:methenyltetrahydromethanopterin cyclohydrolase